MALIIDDILIGVGGLLVYEGVIWGIDQYQHWRLGRKTKEVRVKLDLTEEDKHLIEKCREVMGQQFPEGIESRMKGMSASERMQFVKDLVNQLSGIYGVTLSDVAFLTIGEIGSGCLGYYDFNYNTIRFNLDLLSCDDPQILRAMIDTIFHEMRHALQYRAVTDSTCTYGSEEQRRLWALNFANYIPAHVDFAYYQEQILEVDARVFAEEVIKGF